MQKYVGGLSAQYLSISWNLYNQRYFATGANLKPDVYRFRNFFILYL